MQATLTAVGLVQKQADPFKRAAERLKELPSLMLRFHKDEDKLSKHLKPFAGQKVLPYSLVAEAIKDGNAGRPCTIITASHTYAGEPPSI
ncbi:hypothetical protein JCM3774_001899 [Rhodotorula dairenensis]